MPYYVFECDNGHLREVEARIGEAPKTALCPCGLTMRRSWKNLNISGKVEGGTNGGAKIGR
jgi:predicted nucleic acid-binding Zn ribbon protein